MTMPSNKQLKMAVELATEESCKTALLNYIGLTYAEQLKHLTIKELEIFLKEIGIKPSFCTQLKDMMKLHKIIKDGRAERFLKQAE